MTLTQSIDDPIHDLIIKDESLENMAKLGFEHFFASVRFWTFSFVSGAVIVNVFLPFFFSATRAQPQCPQFTSPVNATSCLVTFSLVE